MRTILPFYQLGLHCCKQQHGRTFQVKTAINASGGAVVGFFSGDTDVFPNACGSFEKLKGDNSVLASRCVEWGKEKGPYRVGKWGHEGQKELSVYSAFIVGSYHRITWPGSNIWECDDTLEKIAASGDFWRIYFRWKLCCHFCILEHFFIYFWDASIQYYDVKSLKPRCMINSKLSFKILSIRSFITLIQAQVL